MINYRNISGIVIYIYFLYDIVFSLKLAFITETCRWWIITIKFAYRFDLYLFYY